MRLLIGAGTPKEAAGRPLASLLFVYTDEAVTIILVAAFPDRSAILVLARYRLPRIINAGLRQRAVKAQENFPKCGARSERAGRGMSGTLRSEPPPFGAGVRTVCSTESRECLNQNNRQIGKLS